MLPLIPGFEPDVFTAPNCGLEYLSSLPTSLEECEGFRDIYVSMINKGLRVKKMLPEMGISMIQNAFALLQHVEYLTILFSDDCSIEAARYSLLYESFFPTLSKNVHMTIRKKLDEIENFNYKIHETQTNPTCELKDDSSSSENSIDVEDNYHPFSRLFGLKRKRCENEDYDIELYMDYRNLLQEVEDKYADVLLINEIIDEQNFKRVRLAKVKEEECPGTRGHTKINECRNSFPKFSENFVDNAFNDVKRDLNRYKFKSNINTPLRIASFIRTIGNSYMIKKKKRFFFRAMKLYETFHGRIFYGIDYVSIPLMKCIRKFPTLQQISMQAFQVHGGTSGWITQCPFKFRKV